MAIIVLFVFERLGDDSKATVVRQAMSEAVSLSHTPSRDRWPAPILSP